jgi:hypothetical protein
MANIELDGKVTDQTGAAKSGLTVELWTATAYESPGARTAYDVTDTNGVWNFDTQDEDIDWIVAVLEGTSKYLIDGRNSIQLKEIFVTNALKIKDAKSLSFGNGIDAVVRWSTGDSSNHSMVIGLGDSNQGLHITDKAAVATDWNISATTHPNVYIHSNTTPATDYLRLGDHDGTTAYVDVVGGTTLALEIAGNTELTVTSAGLNLPANSDINFTGTTGTNDIVLANGLADALSITDGSADIIVVDTSTSGNVTTFTSALTVGVNDTGHDVQFFGATSGAYLLWDESADKLLTAGGAVVDIVKDKLLIGGTAVTTTAAELNVLDAVTAGTVSASLGVVVDSNKDIGSFRNITLTGELDAGSLDVSGNADIDGTLETDVLTVGGTNVLTGSLITTLGTISAGVWNGTAITGAYINDDIISGQSEITSGLATADELLYSDGGTVKRVGLDTLTTYLAGVNAGTVTSTGLSDSSGVLTLDIQNMTVSTTIADADLIAIDDGAGGTLRKMTRANFIESAALDAINIDGGAIDGAVIGANSAAAGTFAAIAGTTGTFSGVLSVDDSTESTGTTTGSIHTDGGLGVAKDLVLGATSTVFVGDTANTFMTAGLTINYGAATNEILAYKSDVTHTFTDRTEADTFGTVKENGANGGLYLTGFSLDQVGLKLEANCDATDIANTDTTGDVGCVLIDIFEDTSATHQAVSAGNIFVIRNGSTARFLLKEDGELHLGNPTVAQLDDEEDAMLLRTHSLEFGSGGLIHSKWDRFNKYNRESLVEADIIGRVPDDAPPGTEGLWNISQHMRLLNGAMWQAWQDIREVALLLSSEQREKLPDRMRNQLAQLEAK